MATQRQRIWGWWFFDWASQPYSTLLLTFVFGPYFAEVASAHYLANGLDAEGSGAAAQAFWGWGQTLSGVFIAILAPILGAVADGSGKRMDRSSTSACTRSEPWSTASPSFAQPTQESRP